MDARAKIAWRDGVPVSLCYDDPYYSFDDGLSESTHVFLDGNDLPARMRPGFHVAELGFGTGLNLLLALRAARATGALPLRYTGFEAHPLSPGDMAAALSAFPALAADAAALVAWWAEGPEVRTTELEATVIIGDARDTLPLWRGRADAWFLDGFAPARNPELWSDALMAEVAHHTAPMGTLATYTAAGHVRRALDAAGFDVSPRPGFGRKRHMTTARLR